MPFANTTIRHTASGGDSVRGRGGGGREAVGGVGGVGGDEFGSTDEVKVYKEEGDEENNKSFAENLSEEKTELLTETEQVG